MSFSLLPDPVSLKHLLFSHPDKATSIPLEDVRSCVLHTFSDGSFNSKILHHISFILVNLGFTMPIKLYSIKDLNCDKILYNKH